MRHNMTNDTTAGCLFDNYALKDKMILWIKERNGNAKRLEHDWTPSIYVASYFKSDLKSLVQNSQILPFIKEYDFVEKYECPGKSKKTEVLKLRLNDSFQIFKLAENIEKHCKRFGQYRLYNVDISREQSYMYEHDIYPTGIYDIRRDANNKGIMLKWNLNNDSICSFDYDVPRFKTLYFKITPKKESQLNSFGDKIQSFTIFFNEDNGDIHNKEEIEISKNDETETILDFSSEVKRIDPDTIITSNGDQILFPYLFYRSKTNCVLDKLKLSLNREKSQNLEQNNTEPSEAALSSFMSYGRVHFRPKKHYLYGRIHIDVETSFIYKETGLDGLSEISRICRIPLQIASRSTIGKCLSSLYFYNAQRNDILVAWKPHASEVFKTFSDLLNADRGGFIFESKPGIYQKVVELDFVSLYPNIMLKKNISSETIICDCCCNDVNNKVPGLDHLYHICKKIMGIVPASLKLILERRLEYKNRKNNNSLSNNYKSCCNKRQAALKWVLVTSFGYLGFNNSKFGKIDAHIAVCAFARNILLQTSKIAERHGYNTIHGIVDSIWIGKKHDNKKDDENISSYLNLIKDIEGKTGFQISFEGIYKWIFFDSSKGNPRLPALNRYFGVFNDGTIKARGIETRRHDTPPLFAKFQNELLQTMSYANNVREVKEMLPTLESTYNKYKYLILSEKVCSLDLVFTKRISKDSNEYTHRKTIESCVVQLLSNNGKLLHAGEEIKYIILDFDNKKHRDRAKPIELIEDSNFNYDTKRYCELLYGIYDSIVHYFRQSTLQ
jgi:DNA polymerase-2